MPNYWTEVRPVWQLCGAASTDLVKSNVPMSRTKGMQMRVHRLGVYWQVVTTSHKYATA